VHITPTAEGKYDIGDIGVGPVLHPQIEQVLPGSPAARAGIQNDDVIVGIDDERDLTYKEVVDRIRKHPKEPIRFALVRHGQPVSVMVTPDDNGGVGQVGMGVQQYETVEIRPGVVGAIRMSLAENWQNAGLIGRTLIGLFTRETPVKQLMGPVAIAQMSGAAASLGLIPMLDFMAMISLNLGLINLMPIPVMDGGQIAILAIEGATRRNFSVKIKERILLAGFALVVLLMVTVIYNDIARLFR
jgi:regulator of sigma E protease